MGMNHLDEHRRWRADLAAYLLGSLEPDETAALELHLEDCRRCRDELDWLRPAIDVIPASIPQLDPPEALRARLLAEVRSDVAGAEPVHSSKPAAPARIPFAARMRGFLWRPGAAYVGIALIVAVIAGYALGGGGGAGVTTIRGQAPGGVSAKLERSGDSGTLELAGLKQLPSASVYQAWVRRGTRIEPSSLFGTRRNGTASAAIPHHLDGANQVMVTVEPRGGSSHPTGSPVASVTLPG
jgi:anti-sigma-K factor RskA